MVVQRLLNLLVGQGHHSRKQVHYTENTVEEPVNSTSNKGKSNTSQSGCQLFI